MAKNIRIKFAKRLRELRLKRKWTQEELAEFADFVQQGVRVLLRGRAIMEPINQDANVDAPKKASAGFQLANTWSWSSD